LTLTLVIQACYEYHLTWARVPRIVREMSGNFAVSGEWSPCLSGQWDRRSIAALDL